MKDFNGFMDWFLSFNVRLGFWGTLIGLGLIGAVLLCIPTPPTFFIGIALCGVVTVVTLTALITMLVYILKSDYDLGKSLKAAQSTSVGEEVVNSLNSEHDNSADKNAQRTHENAASFKDPRLASSHPQVGATDNEEQEDLRKTF